MKFWRLERGSLILLMASALIRCAASAHVQRSDPQTDIRDIQRTQKEIVERIEQLEKQLFLLSDRLDELKVAQQKQQVELPLVKLNPDGDLASREAEIPTLTLKSTRPKVRRTERRWTRQAGQEVTEYERALALTREGKQDLAVVAFADFLRKYPRSDLADNAVYWSGAVYFEQKEYRLALNEFRRVLEQYPGGNKVPDALYKSAQSYFAMQNDAVGCEFIQELIGLYPESEPVSRMREDQVGAGCLASQKK